MIRKGYHDVDEFYPEDRAMTSEERWEELKTWLKKNSIQIHYMGAATIESVVRKMEELEEK